MAEVIQYYSLRLREIQGKSSTKRFQHKIPQQIADEKRLKALNQQCSHTPVAMYMNYSITLHRNIV